MSERLIKAKMQTTTAIEEYAQAKKNLQIKRSELEPRSEEVFYAAQAFRKSEAAMWDAIGENVAAIIEDGETE